MTGGSPAPGAAGWVEVRGARTHNLRDVSVRFPRGAMTAVTGVSGSGKTSLAFDTVFAEGLRRYLESLPTHARRFLERLERPDVDSADGLAPAISIGRPGSAPGPRSTLATIADLHDWLRLLFAHLGQAHCPRCGRAVRAVAPGALAEELLREPDGTRLTLLSPMLRDAAPGRRPAPGRECLADAEKAGFVRVRIDGEIKEVADVAPAEADRAKRIDAVVDRVVVREGVRARLADSVELAMKRSGGEIRLLVQRPGEAEPSLRNESARLACPDCEIAFEKLAPAHFSFNSRAGACPACEGLGLDAAGRPCKACGGARLRPEALACRIPFPDGPGVNIADLLALPLSRLRAWTEGCGASLRGAARAVAAPILSGLRERLAFLDEAGLGYLQADRPGATLSGGELRRVRLASALGQRLGGALYVLDEPSAGLHPRDAGALVALLRTLVDNGNTLLVVEHNPVVTAAADWEIELGPGAGREGGRVLRCGPREAARTPRQSGPREAARTPRQDGPVLAQGPRGLALRVRGASLHNLKRCDAAFPLGRLTVVTGVSGSGKSTLVEDVLGTNAARFFRAGRAERARFDWEGCAAVEGLDAFEKAVDVGAAAHARNPRANLLTFTGAWDRIRALYAATPLAKARGYGPSRFSFNAKGGRCEACKGEGSIRMEMSFLPDVSVPCEACGGRRFNRETLDVHWRGRSVADLLDMTALDALPLFAEIPALARQFETLRDTGLGYLSLGQPLSTLSSGEAQRLLLAAELARPARGRTLYLLDEPTRGQHARDVEKLLAELFKLRDAGHTVVVVDHDPAVMRAADWIVDLGPGGGDGGGRVVAQGPPETVAACPDSATAPFLREAR